jgi:small subunit ribosomal protein S4
VKLFLKGSRCHSEKCQITKRRGKPGKAPRARMQKLSDYGIQLREKQRVKRTYGMLEKQFRIFFERANRQRGVTAENLVRMLEQRLDNVVYRMHFASSRSQARQLVSHGHVMVNDRRVTIPSFLVQKDDVLELRERGKTMMAVKDSLKEYSRSGTLPWLQVDPDSMRGRVLALPRRADVPDLEGVNEQLIVELYSK